MPVPKTPASLKNIFFYLFALKSPASLKYILFYLFCAKIPCIFEILFFLNACAKNPLHLWNIYVFLCFRQNPLHLSILLYFFFVVCANIPCCIFILDIYFISRDANITCIFTLDIILYPEAPTSPAPFFKFVIFHPGNLKEKKKEEQSAGIFTCISSGFSEQSTGKRVKVHFKCRNRQEGEIGEFEWVQSPGSRVQSPESRVQSPKSKVQSPKSKVQSPKSSCYPLPLNVSRDRENNWSLTRTNLWNKRA